MESKQPKTIHKNRLSTGSHCSVFTCSCSGTASHSTYTCTSCQMLLSPQFRLRGANLPHCPSQRHDSCSGTASSSSVVKLAEENVAAEREKARKARELCNLLAQSEERLTVLLRLRRIAPMRYQLGGRLLSADTFRGHFTAGSGGG